MEDQDMEIDHKFEFDDEIGRVEDQIKNYISSVADAVEYVQKHSVPTALRNEKSMVDSQFDIERK